jgi:hypothetical protein
MKNCDNFFRRFYTQLSTGSVPGLCYISLSFRSWFWLPVNDWSKWPRCVFLRHMGGDLVFGLITTRVFGVFVLSRLCASYAMQRPGFVFNRVVAYDNLDSIKFHI